MRPFQVALVVNNPPTNTRDAGSIPGLGRSPGEGNDSPLQYSCLGNPMDGEAWRATYSTWGLEESDTTERLNNDIGDGVEVVNQERVLGYVSMQTHISHFVWHQAHHWPLMA